MFVFSSADEVPSHEGMNVTLTMGFFDGVHLGHAKILEKVGAFYDPGVQISGLVTFEPHPAEVLSPQNAPALLTTRNEKLEILKQHKLSYILFVPFTPELAAQPAARFVEEVLVGKLGVELIIVGYDTRFGRGREGNVELLKKMGAKHGFKVESVDAVKIGGKPVSSTATRELLLKGDVRAAAAMLGRNYALSGGVVKGIGLGKKLSIPTANIESDPKKLIPADGVYAAWCETPGGRFRSAVSIGMRPTVPQKQPRRAIEAHLLGFDGDLYGAEISLEFVRTMREQRKFDGAKALVAQMRKDIELAEKYL